VQEGILFKSTKFKAQKTAKNNSMKHFVKEWATVEEKDKNLTLQLVLT